MKYVLALLASALVTSFSYAARQPGEDVALAEAHSRLLSPEVAYGTRYFSAYHLSDPREIEEAEKDLNYHLWELSRRANPPHVVRVAPGLWAANLEFYGIPRTTFGRLTFVDPYFHASLTKDGSKVDKVDDGFWLNTPDIDRLKYKLTSVVPIVRYDWFIVTTCVQQNRGEVGEGVGYYDFIGVKNRDDFESFCGLDRKLAAKRRGEIAAIVKRSGVSQYPRQVVWLAAAGYDYFLTLDTIKPPLGRNDALENLNEEYEHDAEEHYGFGPGGLFAYLLCDKEGKLQNRAPGTIGHDRTKISNDREIDVCLSCRGCHIEGIRPVNDWKKQAFAHARRIGVKPGQEVRVNEKYLQSLDDRIARANTDYARNLKRCNGRTPQQQALAMRALWNKYYEQDLSLSDCAAELGCSPLRLWFTLVGVAANGVLAPSLVDLTFIPPERIRRETFEKYYQVLHLYLLGGVIRELPKAGTSRFDSRGSMYSG